MTKEKFLLCVIDKLIAPMTVIYFVHENYSHKDFSEFFHKIMIYYQTYMDLYDKAIEEIEKKGNSNIDFISPLLLCELDKTKNEVLKGFFQFLESTIIQKQHLEYNVTERYYELLASESDELDIYVKLVKELRKLEELKR